MFRESRQVDKPNMFVDLAWNRMQLLFSYKLSKIEGRVVLFKAKTVLSEYKKIAKKDNGWGSYAKQGLEVYLVPGDHETILKEPNVSFLAEQLDNILK